MDENKTLATELLHEVKKSAKRWFVIAIIELGIIVAIVAGFVWYLTLPIEEIYIEQEADHNSTNFVGGGNVTNGETEDKLQEESDSQKEKEGMTVTDIEQD